MSRSCSYSHRKPNSQKSEVLHDSPQIIATLGPNAAHINKIRDLIRAGTAIFRINTSHPGPWSEWVRSVRHIAEQEEQAVRVMIDLPGPKYRIGAVDAQYSELKVGDVLLFTRQGGATGQDGMYTLPHADIFEAVEPGMILKLSDGRMELEITQVGLNLLTAIVTQGGFLRSHAGVNVPEADLKSIPITETDIQNIKATIDAQPHIYCGSFIGHGNDIDILRDMIYSHIEEDSDYQPLICAKVETAQGLRNLDTIAYAADLVMCGRGDMACEIERVQVPLHTRRLVNMCRSSDTPAIVATGILETMEKSEYPSRAELDSIYHLVHDGYQYFMLSNETAIGDHPVKAVAALREAIDYAWQDRLFDSDSDLMNWRRSGEEENES